MSDTYSFPDPPSPLTTLAAVAWLRENPFLERCCFALIAEPELTAEIIAGRFREPVAKVEAALDILTLHGLLKRML